MKITIDQTTYTAITNLSFAPEVDVTGNTVPINEFSCDIQTEDAIDIGQATTLRDNRNRLFAKYYITYAEHDGPNRVHLVAKSPLCLLQNDDLPAVMYTDKKAQDALEDTLNSLGSSLGSDDWALDNSLKNVELNGFCPAQTPRDRLQWICYVLGAYVKTAFDTKLRILPLDRTAEMIPRNATFWRPRVNYRDWVTKIQTNHFAFDQREPSSGEEYVIDGNGTKYVVTATQAALAVDGVPSGARVNVMTVSDIMLINQDNVSSVLGRLAGQYFPRAEIDADVIDNGDYIPGQYVQVYTDEQTIMAGFIQRATFAFGLQARASLHLVGASVVPCAELQITYLWGRRKLGRETYDLPIGFIYEIEAKYIDKIINDHRYIFRPTEDTITGTIAQGGTDVRVQCEPALDLYRGVLHVISVDEVTEETTQDETIGVIA